LKQAEVKGALGMIKFLLDRGVFKFPLHG